jgi:hypothetical protein
VVSVSVDDGLQPNDGGRLRPAVEASLNALATKPEDAALRALAVQYATTVDDAAEVAEAAALIEPEDEDQAKYLAALQRRVERLAVLAELGPKLQAALDALGASPKSRAAMSGKGVPTGDKPASALDRARDRRDRRARPNGAATVDPAAS